MPSGKDESMYLGSSVEDFTPAQAPEESKTVKTVKETRKTRRVALKGAAKELLDIIDKAIAENSSIVSLQRQVSETMARNQSMGDALAEKLIYTAGVSDGMKLVRQAVATATKEAK